VRAPAERVRALLELGEIELLGIMPRASNYTFAARVTHDDLTAVAVYKPRDGETPLWDFPDGTLYAREVAAYELSNALGWDLVPLTILREGPHGIGSLQLFVDAEPGAHYLSMMPEHADRFRLVAALDVIANNADRKSGHCMLERETGAIRVIDHGVCFHTEPKLRTVIWDFAGEPLPPTVVSAVRGLDDAFYATLSGLLDADEVRATRARAEALLRAGAFPDPPLDRRPYPWPHI
jgi:hypothetical protein